jgi:hypothetical protein
MSADASGNDVEVALDRERLVDWLVEQSLVDRREALVVDPISDGDQNIVVRPGGGAQRMIPRCPPRVVPDGRGAAMEREFRLLTALDGTDVPHVGPLAIRTDHDVLGATFSVVSEVDGWSPAASRSWPEPFGVHHGLALGGSSRSHSFVVSRLLPQSTGRYVVSRVSAGRTASASGRSIGGSHTGAGSASATSPASATRTPIPTCTPWC